MHITILSVNTAKSEPIATKSGQTGIFKRPRHGPVFVGETGLCGDSIVDLINHGGKDQAVYLYSREDYDWWASELGHEIDPGTFGENLTVSGLQSATVCVGDRYRIGDVLIEVTAPRIPCNTLAIRMGDAHFVKRFMAAKRPGIYCRVLQTGSVAARDRGTVELFTGEKITLLELSGKYPYATLSPEDRKRYLSAPTHWKLSAFLRGEIAKP
jgi:MOSC domain-containing protein YiiM